MSRRFLGLLLSLVLLCSLAACSRANENALLGREELYTEINKEEKNPESNIAIEGLIEMRNSSLWLSQKDLDKLSLDGESYKLPEELLEAMSFSHVKINYPLLIFNSNNVYNLEEKKLILNVENIISALEKEWGKTIDVNGAKLHDDTIELEPKSFDFIDNAVLSPSKKKVAFSIHLYLAASFSTITGVLNVENSNIDFVEGPFIGQVQEIIWSPDENYFAYTLISNISEYDIYIINSSSLKKVVSITSTELLEEELAEKQPQGEFHTIAKLSEWLDNSYLPIQLIYMETENDIEQEFTKIIKYY